MRELTCRAAPAHRYAKLAGLRTTGDQRESSSCRPCRTLHVLNQSTKAIPLGMAQANRSVENLFRDFCYAAKQCAATSQHDTTRKLSLPTSVFDLVGNVHQNFFRARLQNIAQDLPGKLTWCPAAH